MTPRNAFIVGWIVFQMAAPASYYLRTDRAERYDERFAWRMFSDVRMLRCQAEYRVDDDPVKLTQHFHTAWGSLLQRGRTQVVDGVGQRLCDDHPNSTVKLKLTCREPDRSIHVISDGLGDVCEVR
ncbi:MAG: hypothetical protein KC912_09965 [Proteobacteria bacterium]|nr:hypothetical protein [Pseudomonadota bacterium]